MKISYNVVKNLDLCTQIEMEWLVVRFPVGGKFLYTLIEILTKSPRASCIPEKGGNPRYI